MFGQCHPVHFCFPMDCSLTNLPAEIQLRSLRYCGLVPVDYAAMRLTTPDWRILVDMYVDSAYPHTSLLCRPLIQFLQRLSAITFFRVSPQSKICFLWLRFVNGGKSSFGTDFTFMRVCIGFTNKLTGVKLFVTKMVTVTTILLQLPTKLFNLMLMLILMVLIR